ASGDEPKKLLQLYSHWMSSCSWRVRIALCLKGLEYEYKAVDSIDPSEFLKLNPMGYVPVLVDDNVVVSDSFAIILYLEEKYRQRSLLPLDLHKRAINYQAASIVTSSIQPLQNLGLLKYIEENVSPGAKLPLAQYHIRKGFVVMDSPVSGYVIAALEKLLNEFSGKYATGDEIFLADIYLAPQLRNAITRFSLDMSDFPLLSRLHEAYSHLSVFQKTMPENQPDAPVQTTS
ncbi:hypothetical protein RJ639_035242, partial [Escallonia herrerae]